MGCPWVSWVDGEKCSNWVVYEDAAPKGVPFILMDLTFVIFHPKNLCFVPLSPFHITEEVGLSNHDLDFSEKCHMSNRL